MKDINFENKSSHFLLTILIPFLFIYIIDTLLRKINDMFSLIPGWFLIAILLIDLIKIILINLFYFKLSRGVLIGLKVFFMLGMLFAFYILIFSRLPFIVIYYIVLLFVMMIISFLIQIYFKPREILSYLINNHKTEKDNYSGNVYNYSKLSFVNLNKIKNIIIFLQVFILSFVIFLFSLKFKLTGTIFFIIIIYFIISALIFGLLNRYQEEQFYIINDYKIMLKDKIFRFIFSIFLLIISFIFALIFVSNISITPPVFLKKLFLIFFTLIEKIIFYTFFFILFLISKLSSLFTKRNIDLMRNIRGLDANDNLSIFIFALIIKFIILGLILFFIYIIFRPLILKLLEKMKRKFDFFKLLKKLLSDLYYILIEFIKLLPQIIKSLFILKKDNNNNKDFISLKNIKMKKNISIKKRREISRVLRAFIILIQWGVKNNLKYLNFYAPCEYLDLVAGKNPKNHTLLKKIGSIFEESVFSDHILDDDIIKEYINGINKIVAD